MLKGVIACLHQRQSLLFQPERNNFLCVSNTIKTNAGISGKSYGGKFRKWYCLYCRKGISGLFIVSCLILTPAYGMGSNHHLYLTDEESKGLDKLRSLPRSCRQLCPGTQQTAARIIKGSMKLQRRYVTAILHAEEVRRQCLLGSRTMTETK